MKLTLVLITIFFLNMSAYGQALRDISGKVTNENGQPLQGVTIRSLKTKQLTLTDKSGQFKLSGIQTGGGLVFSMVGHQDKTIIVDTAGFLQVQLVSSENAMDEVVVIGYGEVKRKDLTGSVGTVDMKDLDKAPVVSFGDALAGRVAGVQVTSPDGQPGNESDIVIRGGNSITQSNAPLYVIDGFPMEDANANTINPEDIASIDILKDASSTAIYGARGANGVIIITTKLGKAGPPVVSYNNWVGYQRPIAQLGVMSPYEFVRYQLDLDSVGAAPYYLAEGKTLEDYKNVEGINWQDQMFHDAIANNHNISVRGGNQATRYSLSGSYLDQQGVVINTGYRRYQGRFNIVQKLGKNLRAGVNTNYTYSIRNGQILNTTTDDLNATSAGNASSYRMYSAWGYRPVAGNGSDEDLLNGAFDPDITSTTDLRVNPALSASNTYDYVFGRAFTSNAFLEVSFLRDFKFKVTGGLSDNNIRYEKFNNSKTAAGSPSTVYGQTYGINGSINNLLIRSLLNENILTYSKIFDKKHKVDALAGFTMQKSSSERNGYVAILLPNESLGINGLDQGTILDKNFANSYSTVVSFLGRVNYSYDSKYLLTLSLRRDGSSKFFPESRWGYFPSAAVAWNLGNEGFIKDISAVSDAKLRVSYGITGNNRVSDFAYRSILDQEVASNSTNTKSGYYFGGDYVKGTVPTTVGNEHLRWEKTGNLDMGLDVSLLDKRVNFTADYYYKRTSDLLLNASLPTSFGYATGYKNIGVVVNKGLELTLNTINISTKDFSWASNLNIAFNNNKIVQLNGGEPSITTRVSWNAQFNNSLPYIAIPGQSVALFYGYVFDGLYQLDDFNALPDGSYELKANIPNNGDDRSTIKPGYIKYKDLNGDGVVDANDQTIIGNPNPKHIGGFSNNFRYKQFDLNVFFQWSYGNDVLNANRIVFEGAEGRRNLNMFKDYENRWSMDNQNTDLPVAGGYGPNVYSDRTIEDGSFLRLKTVSLGYNLSPEILSRLKIKSLRISFSAQNLITWTNYSGLDPEVSVRNSALTPGFDWSPYPRARTMTLGLNATF